MKTVFPDVAVPAAARAVPNVAVRDSAKVSEAADNNINS